MPTKEVQPAIGHLIECQGHDWSPFSCRGEIRLVKTGKRKAPIRRFFRQLPDGTFESDRETWSDVETWKYVGSKNEQS